MDQCSSEQVSRKSSPFQVPGFTGISMAQLNHIIQHKLGMRPAPTTDGCLFLKPVNSKLFVCAAPGYFQMAGGLSYCITAIQPALHRGESKALMNSADVLLLPVGFYPVHAKQLRAAKPNNGKGRAALLSQLLKGELKIKTFQRPFKHNIGYLAILEMETGTINIFNCDCCKPVSRLTEFCRKGIYYELTRLLGKQPRELSTSVEALQSDFRIDMGCALPMLYYMEMTLKGQTDIQPFTDKEIVMSYFHHVWAVMKGMTLEVTLDREEVSLHIRASRPVIVRQACKVEVVPAEENEEIHPENPIVNYEQDCGKLLKWRK